MESASTASLNTNINVRRPSGSPASASAHSQSSSTLSHSTSSSSSSSSTSFVDILSNFSPFPSYPSLPSSFPVNDFLCSLLAMPNASSLRAIDVLLHRYRQYPPSEYYRVVSMQKPDAKTTWDTLSEEEREPYNELHRRLKDALKSKNQGKTQDSDATLRRGLRKRKEPTRHEDSEPITSKPTAVSSRNGRPSNGSSGTDNNHVADVNTNANNSNNTVSNSTVSATSSSSSSSISNVPVIVAAVHRGLVEFRDGDTKLIIRRSVLGLKKRSRPHNTPKKSSKKKKRRKSRHEESDEEDVDDSDADDVVVEDSEDEFEEWPQQEAEQNENDRMLEEAQRQPLQHVRNDFLISTSASPAYIVATPNAGHSSAMLSSAMSATTATLQGATSYTSAAQLLPVQAPALVLPPTSSVSATPPLASALSSSASSGPPKVPHVNAFNAFVRWRSELAKGATPSVEVQIPSLPLPLAPMESAATWMSQLSIEWKSLNETERAKFLPLADFMSKEKEQKKIQAELKKKAKQDRAVQMAAAAEQRRLAAAAAAAAAAALREQQIREQQQAYAARMAAMIEEEAEELVGEQPINAFTWHANEAGEIDVQIASFVSSGLPPLMEEELKTFSEQNQSTRFPVLTLMSILRPLILAFPHQSRLTSALSLWSKYRRSALKSHYQRESDIQRAVGEEMKMFDDDATLLLENMAKKVNEWRDFLEKQPGMQLLHKKVQRKISRPQQATGHSHSRAPLSQQRATAQSSSSASVSAAPNPATTSRRSAAPVPTAQQAALMSRTCWRCNLPAHPSNKLIRCSLCHDNYHVACLKLENAQYLYFENKQFICPLCCHLRTSAIDGISLIHWKTANSALPDYVFGDALKEETDTVSSTDQLLSSLPDAVQSRLAQFNVSSEIIEDEVCQACGGGGELLLCDSCTDSYHLECVGLRALPEGLYFCPLCAVAMNKAARLVEFGENSLQKKDQNTQQNNSGGAAVSSNNSVDVHSMDEVVAGHIQLPQQPIAHVSNLVDQFE